MYPENEVGINSSILPAFKNAVVWKARAQARLALPPSADAMPARGTMAILALSILLLAGACTTSKVVGESPAPSISADCKSLCVEAQPHLAKAWARDFGGPAVPVKDQPLLVDLCQRGCGLARSNNDLIAKDLGSPDATTACNFACQSSKAPACTRNCRDAMAAGKTPGPKALMAHNLLRYFKSKAIDAFIKGLDELWLQEKKAWARQAKKALETQGASAKGKKDAPTWKTLSFPLKDDATLNYGRPKPKPATSR